MSELLEKILGDDNIRTAMQRVKSNGGTFGVDKMELSKLDDYMEEHLEEIRHEMRTRTYVPNPVKRVEIPKPNGGVRKLGIPTVVDRTIQQAIVQVSVNTPMDSDREDVANKQLSKPWSL